MAAAVVIFVVIAVAGEAEVVQPQYPLSDWLLKKKKSLSDYCFPSFDFW